MRFSLNEEQARFWGAISSIVTTLALVIAGIWSVVQFQHTAQLEQENREKDLANLKLQLSNAKFDAQRPFYLRQLELCELASSSSSVLATPGTRSTTEVERARADFWRLYWGPLGIVEKGGVEHAMIRFGNCLRKNCEAPIESLSLDLAHACRDLISESWNLELPAIDNAPKLEKTPPAGPAGN